MSTVQQGRGPHHLFISIARRAVAMLVTNPPAMKKIVEEMKRLNSPLNKRAVVTPVLRLEIARCKNSFASAETFLTDEPLQLQLERKIVRQFADPKLALLKLIAVHALGTDLLAWKDVTVFPAIH